MRDDSRQQRGPTVTDLDIVQTGEHGSRPHRIDRFGRPVRLDKWDLEYVRDEEGGSFYITDCCDASAKGMEDYIGCRSCHEEIDSSLGGIPEPLDEDETDKDRERLAWFKDFNARMLKKMRDQS